MRPDRHNLEDASHGKVRLVPWLVASPEERAKALHPFQALRIVERWRERKRGRELAEVAGLLAVDRGMTSGVGEERLAVQIFDAVKARQLIAVPGWWEARPEHVAPPAPPLPVEPPAVRAAVRARKEATESDAEPTIRLVNLESPHFVPHAESIRISYAIDGPVEKAATVRMLVKSLGTGPDSPIIATLNLPGPHRAAGNVTWNGDASMGAGFITLRGSPYELTFELTSKSGNVSFSEPATVALSVSSVRLTVDSSGLLPVPEKHRPAIGTLVADLKKSALPDESSGRVIIDSAIFPIADEERDNRASFREYEKRMDDGVPIPLLLEVRLRSKTGGDLRSPAALVGTRVLWTFAYADAQELSASLDARNVVEPQRGFLMGVLTDQEQSSSPPGTAAPIPLGGRRSTPSSARPAPTFWEGTAAWPLERPTVRTWATFTRSGGAPTSITDCGVYFRSGRIAGDIHRVWAVLDLDEVLDTDGSDAPQVPSLRSNALIFTNWRRTEIVADWFVGETSEIDYAAVRGAFQPAAVIVEPMAGLSRIDMTEHWTRAYAKLAMEARDNASPFIADALDPDPQDQAIRFRSLAEFHQAPGARTYRESVKRRARNFLVARDEAEYRRECDRQSWLVLDRLVSTIKPPNGGITVLKFAVNRLHNMQDQSNEVGGFSYLLGRDDTLVLQFTRRANWKVTTHEIGHALFLTHAPGHISQTREAGSVDLDAHASNTVCMMSYAGAPTFCALCLLKLGGHDFTRISRHGQIRRWE